MTSATTDLLPHQAAAVTKLLPSRVGALFMDMGTGKSRAAIELACIRQAKIDRVVWFCPVSLKETVRYEILKHTDAEVGDIYLFDAKTRSERLPDCRWYIIGIESMSASNRVVFAASAAITERTMVIVDESSYIKGYKAKRTNRITLLSEQARYRLILTGTPISQGVQDLFAQMKFLSPKILGYRSWHTFARNHLEYSDRYKGLIVSTHNTGWLAEKINPYIYQVTKAECLDLPSKLTESRYCTLTSEQDAAYEMAKERFMDDMLEYSDDSEWQSSVPIFRLFSALQGIVCGFFGDQAIESQRVDLLVTTLGQIHETEKVVVWAKYRQAIRDIVSQIPSACEYHGGLSEQQRHQSLQRWRSEGRVLVATQAAGGHGLDLTAANHVIFYANGFKYSERIQAEDRCHRIGQTMPVTYIDLWARCGIEERIDLAIYRKGSTVEAFKAEVDKIKEQRNRKVLLRKLVKQL